MEKWKMIDLRSGYTRYFILYTHYSFLIAIAGQNYYHWPNDLFFCTMMKPLSLLLLLIFCSSLFLWTSYAQDSSLPARVNFAKVQSARLDWQNTERKKLGLPVYTGNDILQSSAQDRAESLKDMGTVTHQRKATDGYYNYWSIKSRFSDHGVGFSDDSGTLFSESLWWGYYLCSKDDCTDSLIKAIKSTFTFFMNEKGKWNQPHYKAIVSKDFTSVWLGITTVGKQYYLVSHYGRNIVKAEPVKLAKLK